MKALLPLLVLAPGGLSKFASAQSSPTVTPTISAPGSVPSVSGEPVAGELTFALTGSESYVNGYQGTNGGGSSTNISGQAEYVSNSQRHPLSLIYSGGFFFGNGTNVTSSVFQNLGVAQILNVRKWRLGIADTVTFLPSSSLYGVSGVPGSGDIGSTPISNGGIPTESILTNYGEQVNNTVSGSVSRQVTGKTYVDGSASYNLQRFLQSGLNNSGYTASASIGHRYSVRDSIAATYSYTQFDFNTAVAGTTNLTFVANGIAANYNHVFSRAFSAQLSAGPQWISSNNSSLISSRTLFSAAVSLLYSGRSTRASATYSRSPNIGSGVLLGALSDDINLSMQHTFSSRWSGGLTANYGRASGLATLPGANTVTNSFYGGIQANRRLGEDFAFFGSYSVATQTATGLALAQNAFNGTANIVSAGITYTPRSIRFGRP